MRKQEIEGVLEAVAAGRLSVEEAKEALAKLPFLDLGFAKLDLHRELRNGAAEVVFAEGKSIDQLLGIVEQLVLACESALVTRLRDDQARALLQRFPSGRLEADARLFTVGESAPRRGTALAVLAAGTSDLPVAEEACLCAEWLGHTVTRFYDVGVAGVHRLLSQLDELRRAQAAIVVAGMDGALPTLVAGVLASPVIAVPTSVGYGSSFGGLAALLTMLNACAPGLAVVNIDNGYGAAALAHRILAPLAPSSPS